MNAAIFKRPDVRVLAGSVCVSFSALFVKASELNPTSVGLYRSLAAAAVLIMLAIKFEPRLTVSVRSVVIAAAAASFLWMDLSLWHRSIHSIGPGLATLLNNLQVFLLAFYGVIFCSEKLAGKFYLGALFSIAGLMLTLGIDWSAYSSEHSIGVVFALVSALCYAFYIINLRKSQTLALPPLGGMAVIAGFCAFFFFAEALLLGESLRVDKVSDGMLVAAYGVTCQVLGWLLIAKALPSVVPSRVGLLLLIQPGLAYLWDALIFNAQILPIEFVGVLVTTGGIYLAARR